MSALLFFVIGITGVIVLAWHEAGRAAWNAFLLAFALLLTLVGAHWGWLLAVWGIFLAIAALLNLDEFRRRFLTGPAFRAFARAIPPMSDTEREALEAGGVWWEAELFSGRPHWEDLLGLPAPQLSDEEQAFLDGPVEELCALVNDWQVHQDNDLSPAAWAFIREKGFFGMIIPKEFGGLGFSALGHSQVVLKLSSRSVAAAVTVMVPNSLGPAELLLHYGTDAQRQQYLPRLARGEEVPCFALTGPEAGSDASSIPDTGIVCRGRFEGREITGIRLNWEKRYITLAPVATVLGLAFRLRDPEQLLGEKEDIGITCALIPTSTPGIRIGERHNPLGVPFQNGPTLGKDVFIPLDWIIGGPERAGQGWTMLMERLGIGRGISLPALSTGAGKLVSRGTGGYARIRRQFGLPIGRFEGVEALLATIAADTYQMDAARTLTTTALDQGINPPVVTAIAKYNLTEAMRRTVNAAMDVHGGSGIMLGPRNLLADAYQSIPIGITVEGANALTRGLITYGQGAMRCHPFVQQELATATDPDAGRGLRDFDRLLGRHVAFTMANFMRAAVHGFTGSRLAPAPRRKLARYYRALARLSAAFAVVSDIAMLVLGGALKRREHLSGRLADALSELYLASAVLKRFTDDGEPGADQPLARYCLDRSLYRIQQSLFGVLQNFPLRALAWTLRLKLFPFGRSYRMPPDRLARDAAAVLLASSPARDRLTRGIFLPQDESAPLNRIERALEAVIAAEASEQKLRHARTTGKLDPGADLAAALKAGIVEPNEVALVEAASALRREVIAVDCFGAPRHGAPASKAKARTKTRRARSPRKPRKPKSRSS